MSNPPQDVDSTPAGVMTTSADSSPPREMTVRGAIFLGVGAMVGAGIFALLGEAGAVAGSAVWVSFLIAGLISALLGYAVVKLGVKYPSSGGILTYLMEGFGNGRLVGIASWLGYYSAILLVCSMVAVSFGDYATSLLIGTEAAAAGFVLLFFVIDTLRNDPSTFATTVVLVVLAIALDFLWKKTKLKTESYP
jgi:amino acid transporter